MNVEWKKRPLGNEARQKHSHGLHVPRFKSFSIFLSIATVTNRMESCGRARTALCSGSSEFLRVLLQSYVTGRLNVQTQASRGSFGQGVAVQGGCTHSEPVLDPLMEGKPTEIPTNTDTVTKQLCRGAIVKFSFLSLAFLFPFGS